MPAVELALPAALASSLAAAGQDHVLAHWQQLDSTQRQSLSDQLAVGPTPPRSISRHLTKHTRRPEMHAGTDMDPARGLWGFALFSALL